MRIYRTKNFAISPGFCFALSLVLLILPIRWVGAWLIAAAIHELFHYIALKLCGIEISNIKLGFSGAVIETEPMSNSQETLCAIAGPIGGLAITLLGPWIPCTAICAVIHSLYNLLPIYPLDGARALRGVLQMLFNQCWTFRIQQILECSVLGLLLIGSVLLWLRSNAGVLPLLCVGIIFYKKWSAKFPCKDS